MSGGSFVELCFKLCCCYYVVLQESLHVDRTKLLLQTQWLLALLVTLWLERIPCWFGDSSSLELCAENDTLYTVYSIYLLVMKTLKQRLCHFYSLKWAAVMAVWAVSSSYRLVVIWNPMCHSLQHQSSLPQFHTASLLGIVLNICLDICILFTFSLYIYALLEVIERTVAVAVPIFLLMKLMQC